MNSILFILLLYYNGYVSPIIAETDVKDEDLTLELVQVLLRHGARTPEQAAIDLCNFTLASLYEPLGLGQLTNEGKQQEFLLGKYLRVRYSRYLKPFYNLDDVYAYASELARTQMSLQLVLAGLYPLEGPTVWGSHMNWSPIPYLSYPIKLDILLESHKSPKFKKLKKQVHNSDEFKIKLAKFSEFFKFIEERTIIKDNNSLSNIDSTFDVLIANEYMKLPLPDWYTPEVRQSFIEVAKIVKDADVATPEMKRVGPGPLIKTFIQNMNLHGTFKNPRKIYVYGGHQTNIAMFTRAHNISEFRYPPFGSALIFEKLRDSKGQVYVRLLAWDGSGNLMTLKLGNYEKFCPIEDYLKIVEELIPSEEEIDDMLGYLSTKHVEKICFEDDKVTLAQNTNNNR